MSTTPATFPLNDDISPTAGNNLNSPILLWSIEDEDHNCSTGNKKSKNNKRIRQDISTSSLSTSLTTTSATSTTSNNKMLQPCSLDQNLDQDFTSNKSTSIKDTFQPKRQKTKKRDRVLLCLQLNDLHRRYTNQIRFIDNIVADVENIVALKAIPLSKLHNIEALLKELDKLDQEARLRKIKKSEKRQAKIAIKL